MLFYLASGAPTTISRTLSARRTTLELVINRRSSYVSLLYLPSGTTLTFLPP